MEAERGGFASGASTGVEESGGEKGGSAPEPATVYTRRYGGEERGYEGMAAVGILPGDEIMRY